MMIRSPTTIYIIIIVKRRYNNINIIHNRIYKMFCPCVVRSAVITLRRVIVFDDEK